MAKMTDQDLLDHAEEIGSRHNVEQRIKHLRRQIETTHSRRIINYAAKQTAIEMLQERINALGGEDVVKDLPVPDFDNPEMVKFYATGGM